jgi:hypothetical protein
LKGTRINEHEKNDFDLGTAAFVGLIVHPIQAQSKTEKEAAVLKYQGKFLIVKIDGTSIGAAGGGCA